MRRGYILRLRQSKTLKGISMTLALSLLFEMIQPTVSMALTEGPSQPEVQSFEPIGTTQMVDLFTGDFNYNIPLFNLPGPNGGYPVNLAYHAGVSMDDEASWVGLGWNLNVGALVRNMRGLPDEFLSTASADGNWTGGDYIETKTDMKESWTVGASFGKKFEIAGGDPLKALQGGLNASIRFNNYRGLGASVGYSSIVGGSNSPLSLGLSLDSDNGLGVSPSLSFRRNADGAKYNHSVGVSFNGDLSLSYGFSRNNGNNANKSYYKIQRGNDGFGTGISFATNNFSPSVGNRMNNFNISGGVSFGGNASIMHDGTNLGFFFNTQDYDDTEKKGRKRPVVGYAKKKGEQDFFTKDFVRMNDGQITNDNAVLPHSYYSYDAYASSGQGLSGYFRGKRNDVGRIHDPQLKNESFGASLDFEFFNLVSPPIITPSGALLPPNPLDKHIGIGGAVNFGYDYQGAWNENNELDDDFTDPYPGGIRENHYYQAHGEQTVFNESDLDYMNGVDLALAQFSPKNSVFDGKRKITATENPHIRSARPLSKGRVVRNTLIHSLNNNEVDHLGEFNVRHYEFDASLDLSQEPIFSLGRDVRKPDINSGGVSIDNHNAGFKVLNEDGSYYVYGLPAYNKKEVENLFTVTSPSGDPAIVDVDYDALTSEVDFKQALTQKFINKTTKSPYAHSYMLTSVQGADYVDVKNDGPTVDDLGYWVKFNYVKYGDHVKWRSPYHGASYNRGNSYTGEDDKASYQYGEKEIWYMGRMETKSHIAVFEMSVRQDMKEAYGEYANETDGMGSQSGLKIDSILIYERASFEDPSNTPVPLQVVHLEYDYSLCKDAPNSSASGNGKLTLKKVWFTSLNSTRGELSPYEFDYTSVNLPSNLSGLGSALINPNYKENSYDPWGNYRPYSNGYFNHANFPYVAQSSNSWGQAWMNLYPDPVESKANKEVTQKANDLIASTWSLREIKLPSGGKINIEYESDDYSHVQHKVANQLFKIHHIENSLNIPNLLYDPSTVIDFENTPEYRRIYFELEDPIESNVTTVPDPNNMVYEDYVEPIMKDENGDRNLYFKSLVNLKGAGISGVQEFISGYLKLEADTNLVNPHGVDATSIEPVDGVDCYTRGYVTIETVKKRNGGKFEKYHPIALRAWEYMQTNAPELLNPATFASSQNNGVQSVGDLLGMVTNIVGAIPATAAAFGAIRPYCHGLGFASSIDLDNSGIRLASPDRKKFGGGHRVKQITISDEWSSDTGSSEQSRTYGQIYDYTTTDDITGRVISSGVAQYEPQAGGDENALKYPINYYGKQNLLTNNNLMAEAPMNEALFPGAMVGYRKVTVKSLNTSTQMKNALPASGSQGVGRTGGVTAHEFFTAKDFPTMVTWSELHPNNNTKDVFNVPIPIPFIGSIKRNYYHGSQAFKIELNDMHGKPKSVKSYELNDYKRNAAPITESFYEYQSADISYQGETVKRLVNSVKTIPQSSGQDLTNMEDRLMGVETDLYTDQRENKSFSSSIGLDFNIDLLNSTIPLPSVWPSYTNHKTLFRTYVTNKVVHRSGILKKTKTRDLQTVNESEVLAYDEKAGTPLVSRVKNEFGDYFYSYNVPAYYHYDRMGHAYQNINYTFSADLGAIVTQDPTDPTRPYAGNIEDPTYNAIANTEAALASGSADAIEHLVRGDELLITDLSANVTSGNKYKKAYFLGWKYNGSGTPISAMIQIINPFASSNGGEYTFKVIRSGRRNHYGSMSANYLTKGEISSTSMTTVDGVTGNLDFIQTNVIDDNVLSATASLFKDDWTTIGAPNTVLDLNNDGPYTENPFLSGNSGIFRPYKSYTYVGSRLGNSDMYDNTDVGAGPILSDDGIMSNVPMFTWDLGNIEDYVSNWEWVNEVTRFSTDAYEIENVNRLGIYSSALYGYDNSLTIGVGGNASSFELGVFDFETSLTATPEKLLSQTNMDFSSNASKAVLTEQHTITKATMSASNVLTIETNIPSAGFDVANYVDNMGLSIITRKGAAPETNEGFYFNAKRTNVSNFTGAYGTSYIKFTATPFIEGNSSGSTVNLLPTNLRGHGKITLMTIKDNVSSTPSALPSTFKAHTGKVSLEVTGQAQYDQPQLKMIKDKKYVVSVWVSSDKKKRTYENDDLVKIGTMQGGSYVTMGSSNTEITEIKTTYSNVIEAWQKVDFEFEVKAPNATLVLDFKNASGEKTYIDDVRFSPRTGGITTYVYDPNRFWLRASLNVDNYATFFYYDEEGNLTIKKQETEEGIFTITESRGHVSE